MSVDLVPPPNKLLEDKKKTADTTLHKDYGIDPIDSDLTDKDALYKWADEAIAALAVVVPGEEKRVISKVLGLTTDDYWTAKIGVELPGSTPRHRVIARFARERMWQSVWSLNWDTLLESALEQVGLNRDAGPDNQEWPTAFATNLLSTDFPTNAPNHIVELCKPHGCVHSLAKAEDLFAAGEAEKARELCNRLMIGKTELEKVRHNQHDNAFFNRFRTDVLARPLTSAGWSASEPSLRQVIDESVKPKYGTDKAEELTIIDPVCNDSGHAEILRAYGLEVAQVHCEVSTEATGFTTDLLFLWLQVRFALLNIEKWSCDEWKEMVGERLKITDNGGLSEFLVQFSDNFLPAWVRLCWRAGIVALPPGVDPESFDLEKQNYHIPLRGAATVRDDLKSAASILVMLEGLEDKWDLGRFPGCLWCNDSQHLVIPIPAWAETGKANDLRALKVMFKRLQAEAGHIRTASVMPIKRSPAEPVDAGWGERYTATVPQFFRVPMLADPSNWAVLDGLASDDEDAS